MQRGRFLAIVSSALLIGCGPRSTERTYPVQGQVIGLTPDRQEATVKHGEIKGLMPAMTMPYKIREKAELDAVKPGDLIDATLVIVENDAYLRNVKRVGEAPLEQPPPEKADAAEVAAVASRSEEHTSELQSQR